MAPNAIVDNAVVGKATPEAVIKKIDSVLGEEKVEAD